MGGFSEAALLGFRCSLGAGFAFFKFLVVQYALTRTRLRREGQCVDRRVVERGLRAL